MVASIGQRQPRTSGPSSPTYFTILRSVKVSMQITAHLKLVLNVIDRQRP